MIFLFTNNKSNRHYETIIVNNAFDLEKDKSILLKLIKDNDNFKQFVPYSLNFSLLTVNQEILFKPFQESKSLKRNNLFLKKIKNNFDYTSKYIFALSTDEGDGIICISVAKNEKTIKEKIKNTKLLFENIINSLIVNNDNFELNNLKNNEGKIIKKDELDLSNLMNEERKNTLKECKKIKLKTKQEILNPTN